MKDMTKIAYLFLAVIVISSASGTNAQANDNPKVREIPKSQVNDTPTLTPEEEKELIAEIMKVIQTPDQERQHELVEWIITDKSVRSRVISILRKNRYNISPNTLSDLRIMQFPYLSTGETNPELFRISI